MPEFLDEARTIQDEWMLDTCRIDHPTRDFDRETGKDIETWETVYEGRCRAPREDSSTRVIVTGQTITPATPTVKIPWDITTVRTDDRVTITDSISPGMVGRIIWVTDTSPRTYQSAVTLTCREVR